VRIDGRVTLITGASEGIGASCARVFRRRGARLALGALPGSDLSRFDPEAVTVHGDITDPDVRTAIVEAAVERFGRVDILINNAGVGLYSTAWQSPLELTRRLFDLNLFAALAMTQLVVPHMRNNGEGYIVNIGSVGGKVALPWSTMYCASKSALHSMSEGLRRELKPHGIRVMTVIPGIVATKFREHVLAGRVPPKVEEIRNVLSPDALAERIAQGVARNARQVVMPWTARVFAAINMYFPWLVDAYCASKFAEE
jgi:short-subunit dehydrogenase